MSYPRPFKPGPIEPVVRVGENVLTVDREQYSLYKVAYIEPLPASGPLVVNGGAVGAAAVLAIINPQLTLDMNYGQVAQLRCKVLDDISVTIYQPGGVARHGLNTPVATVNAFTALYFPDDEPSEVFIFENQRIFLQIANVRTVALVMSRMLFYGIKYVLAGPGGASTGGHILPFQTFANITDAERWKQSGEGQPFTVLPTGAWGR